ncbi:MAG: cytochrome c [Rhodocyclaceae bacterium]|nr:cytochrome c [Rhodocyclaceae bacterium]
MRLTVFLAALLLPAAALADAPWGKADPRLGKALHDRSCIACHARLYGGDGSKMYTRPGRLVTNPRELLQRVAACNAMTKAGWIPKQESAVAAWLNQQYYRFDQ